jgi:hypothetical protein
MASVKIDFATSESCAAGAPPRMKMIYPPPIFKGVIHERAFATAHENGYFQKSTKCGQEPM